MNVVIYLDDGETRVGVTEVPVGVRFEPGEMLLVGQEGEEDAYFVCSWTHCVFLEGRHDLMYFLRLYVSEVAPTVAVER